jgi:hypothetical protein
MHHGYGGVSIGLILKKISSTESSPTCATSTSLRCERRNDFVEARIAVDVIQKSAEPTGLEPPAAAYYKYSHPLQSLFRQSGNFMVFRKFISPIAACACQS